MFMEGNRLHEHCAISFNGEIFACLSTRFPNVSGQAFRNGKSK